MKQILQKCMTTWCLINLFYVASLANTYNVSNNAELQNAMSSAQPGDEVIIEDDTYTGWVLELDATGTANDPIVVRAETPGGVSLEQGSRIEIRGDYLVVDGFLLTNSPTANTGRPVQFYNVRGSRLTNCMIDDWGPSGSTTEDINWVQISGVDIRIDHCTFQNFLHPGVTVFVNTGTMSNGDGFGHHRIDHNFFNNKPDGGGNGYESIKVGSGDGSADELNTLVDHNYFYHCDGETEMISNKSWKNTYRNNTVYECAGTFTMRWGQQCVIEGNYFIGNGKKNSGGVRLTDNNHIVKNNYFQDLDGKKSKAAISVMSGYPNHAGGNGGHGQTRDAQIINNTIVNCKEAINFGYYDDDDTFSQVETPVNNTIANNLIYSNSSLPMIIEQTLFGTMGPNTWSNNIVYGTDPGYDPSNNHINQDPSIVQDANDIWRLSGVNSIAVDAAVSTSESVSVDFENQPRDNAPDIGADEFSTASADAVPTVLNDVGVPWATKDIDDTPNEGEPDCLATAQDAVEFNQLYADYSNADTLLSDDGLQGWTTNWFLDGQVGYVTDSANVGMALHAGPGGKIDANHVVLWTQQSFEGDLIIEYDYMKLDDVQAFANMIYIQATGSGEGQYDEDISEWNNLRQVSAMSTYFSNMHLLHISYSSFEDALHKIRGRRYDPALIDNDGSEMGIHLDANGGFPKGENHHIKIIKKGYDLYMEVTNTIAQSTLLYKWNFEGRGAITEGRIGLRQMSSRSSLYSNFVVRSISDNEESPVASDWVEYHTDVLPNADPSGHIVDFSTNLNSNISKNSIWEDDQNPGSYLWKTRADLTDNDFIRYKWYPSYIDMNDIQEVAAPMTLVSKFKWLDNDFDFGPDLEIRGHNKVQARIVRDANDDFFVKIVDGVADASYALPASFDPTEWHVMRLTENNGTWSVYIDESVTALASGTCGDPKDKHMAVFGSYTENATAGLLTGWMGMLDDVAASPSQKPLPEGVFGGSQPPIQTPSWEEYLADVLPENDANLQIEDDGSSVTSSNGRSKIVVDPNDSQNNLYKMKVDMSEDVIKYDWYPQSVDPANPQYVPAPMTIAAKFRWLDNTVDFGPDIVLRGYYKVQAKVIKDNGNYFVKVIDSSTDASYALSASFDPTAWHVIRLTENNGTWSVYIDEDDTALATGTCGNSVLKNFASFGTFAESGFANVYVDWMGLLPDEAGSPSSAPLPSGVFDTSGARIRIENDEEEIVEVQIFPNPTSDYLMVSMGRQSNEGRYRIFNVSGHLLQKGKLKEANQLINVSNLDEGMYLLKIISGEKTISNSKFIKY